MKAVCGGLGAFGSRSPVGGAFAFAFSSAFVGFAFGFGEEVDLRLVELGVASNILVAFRCRLLGSAPPAINGHLTVDIDRRISSPRTIE